MVPVDECRERRRIPVSGAAQDIILGQGSDTHFAAHDR